MLTKSMALEFGELTTPPTRVNCVCPGTVATRIMEDAKVEPDFMQLMATRSETRTLLKHRAMEPPDIANGVLFLSSPLAEMITGTALAIDQGLLVT